MSKIEITETLVERLMEAIWQGVPGQTNYFEVPSVRKELLRRTRKALEAALTPPAEPEIPVSEGMLQAGLDALCHYSNESGRLWADFMASTISPMIYRAMEAKRREEAKITCGWSHRHRRKGDMPMTCTTHNRKDDPK